MPQALHLIWLPLMSGVRLECKSCLCYGLLLCATTPDTGFTAFLLNVYPKARGLLIALQSASIGLSVQVMLCFATVTVKVSSNSNSTHDSLDTCHPHAHVSHITVGQHDGVHM